MYSRNILLAEKRIVCFQSKKVKICRFFLISNNYYRYLKKYFEIFVTNDCFSIFWRTPAFKSSLMNPHQPVHIFNCFYFAWKWPSPLYTTKVKLCLHVPALHNSAQKDELKFSAQGVIENITCRTMFIQNMRS